MLPVKSLVATTCWGDVKDQQLKCLAPAAEWKLPFHLPLSRKTASSVTLGKLSQGGKRTPRLAQVEYLLLRLKQRLIEVPFDFHRYRRVRSVRWQVQHDSSPKESGHAKTCSAGSTGRPKAVSVGTLPGAGIGQPVTSQHTAGKLSCRRAHASHVARLSCVADRAASNHSQGATIVIGNEQGRSKPNLQAQPTPAWQWLLLLGGFGLIFWLFAPKHSSGHSQPSPPH